MAKTGILGQIALPSADYTTVYTVPVETRATISIMTCHSVGHDDDVRIDLGLSDEVPTEQNMANKWIEYGALLPHGGALERSGIVLGPGDRVVAHLHRASASHDGMIAVTVLGIEELSASTTPP